MKKCTAFISTFIISYIFWILFLIQDFNILKLGVQELVVGIVVSIIVSFFTYNFFVKEDGFWLFKKFRIFSLIMFVPVYFWELVKANWDIAKRALSPKLKINPAIVKIETDIKSDWGLALLANCITLTPGTITMDIYEKGDVNSMYIHWIDGSTEDTKEAGNIIKGNFEPYVRRIFK